MRYVLIGGGRSLRILSLSNGVTTIIIIVDSARDKNRTDVENCTWIM